MIVIPLVKGIPPIRSRRGPRRTLQGAIPLGVDRMRQQRHVAEDLIGIRTVGEQASQSLCILVLDRVMVRGPVVTHEGIQQRWTRTYQRLSTQSVTH
ncbi:hypothetical protein GCM10009730_61870 [Streptomyces albidochromogenes]